MERRLRIRLKKSLIGLHRKNKLILRALGLRRVGMEVVHRDSPSLRGMLRQVGQYVEVEDIE